MGLLGLAGVGTGIGLFIHMATTSVVPWMLGLAIGSLVLGATACFVAATAVVVASTACCLCKTKEKNADPVVDPTVTVKTELVKTEVPIVQQSKDLDSAPTGRGIGL